MNQEYKVNNRIHQFVPRYQQKYQADIPKVHMYPPDSNHQEDICCQRVQSHRVKMKQHHHDKQNQGHMDHVVEANQQHYNNTPWYRQYIRLRLSIPVFRQRSPPDTVQVIQTLLHSNIQADIWSARDYHLGSNNLLHNPSNHLVFFLLEQDEMFQPHMELVSDLLNRSMEVPSVHFHSSIYFLNGFSNEC